eukprot:GILJ01027142.1.p1 GENE.GILJ01027142.1~~GILJ01027142.1.p1  ORF type:complete len:353 (-),score=40.21 GILJ01027142.1:142-1200(-)
MAPSSGRYTTVRGDPRDNRKKDPKPGNHPNPNQHYSSAKRWYADAVRKGPQTLQSVATATSTTATVAAATSAPSQGTTATPASATTIYVAPKPHALGYDVTSLMNLKSKSSLERGLDILKDVHYQRHFESEMGESWIMERNQQIELLSDHARALLHLRLRLLEKEKEAAKDFFCGYFWTIPWLMQEMDDRLTIETQYSKSLEAQIRKFDADLDAQHRLEFVQVRSTKEDQIFHHLEDRRCYFCRQDCINQAEQNRCQAKCSGHRLSEEKRAEKRLRLAIASAEKQFFSRICPEFDGAYAKLRAVEAEAEVVRHEDYVHPPLLPPETKANVFTSSRLTQQRHGQLRPDLPVSP